MGSVCLRSIWRPSRLTVVARRSGSWWVILLSRLARWARNCHGLVFLSDLYFRICEYGLALALFVVVLLGGAVPN